jgi:hypothetical protein
MKLLGILFAFALCSLQDLIASENIVKNFNLYQSKNGKSPDFWNVCFFKTSQGPERFEYRTLDDKNCFFAICENEKGGGQIMSTPIAVSPEKVYSFDLEYYAIGKVFCAVQLVGFDKNKKRICEIRLTTWGNNKLPQKKWLRLSDTIKILKIDSKSDMIKLPSKKDISFSYKEEVKKIRIYLQFGSKQEITYRHINLLSSQNE